MAGMQTYENAFFYVNGKLIGDPKFEVRTAPCDLTFDVPAEDNGLTAFVAGLRRMAPVRPEGVVTLSLPWGILGTIKVPAVVQGVTHKGGAGIPSTTTMEGALDERDPRREIANAVRRAIVGDYSDGSVALRACFKGETATICEMGHKIAAGPGCRYRCERKRRKAMRRLLRAAGITRPAS